MTNIASRSWATAPAPAPCAPTPCIARAHAARLNSGLRQRITEAAPTANDTGLAIDLGRADVQTTLTALRAAAADDNADALLFVHSPVAGQPHDPWGGDRRAEMCG